MLETLTRELKILVTPLSRDNTGKKWIDVHCNCHSHQHPHQRLHLQMAAITAITQQIHFHLQIVRH
jgi:hypothetical protein